jgi:hypothetical protein
MLQIFGIRHHGPGSARAVKSALQNLQPDIVLIEGPPEGNAIIKFAGSQDMIPPVALLAYVPDEPDRALFYPFAEFSPEWQGIKYSLNNKIPVRFMDMPLVHKMAYRKSKPETKEEVIPSELNSDAAELSEEMIAARKADSLTYLAEIAGFSDGESWWNHLIEQRMDVSDTFSAVMEAMSALRESKVEKDTRETLLREAWMRKIIRQAEKEGFSRIAVICGAWHAPALVNMPPKKNDDELVRNLPKVKIETTWIPWTYDRLTFGSGYGAGVKSPGWYDHIYNFPEDQGNLWLTKTARIFRERQMDISSAHIIESARLAHALAAMRNLPRPGLEEMTEATQTVMCFGDDTMLRLVESELIVGKRIGRVPADAPQVPLQLDFEKQQKKLRLPSRAEEKMYTLDLRESNDLSRSKFLHRLEILELEWGYKEETTGRGTFKEEWHLQWQPEMMIRLIEMGVWGNTIEDASSAFIIDSAGKSGNIRDLSDFLKKSILAELSRAVDFILQRLDNIASLSSDITQLMQALPPLATVSRYGNVRKTDSALILKIVEGLVTRISIGLPNACLNIDDDFAGKIYNEISAAHESISLLQNEEMSGEWNTALQEINHNSSVNPLIAGKACRLLTDTKTISDEETARSFSLALSFANPPAYTANWLEGFLKNSGSILLLDELLWSLVDQWVSGLNDEQFQNLLPILRRNFSTFSPAERRKLGEKAKGGNRKINQTMQEESAFDIENAIESLGVVKKILGIGD